MGFRGYLKSRYHYPNRPPSPPTLGGTEQKVGSEVPQNWGIEGAMQNLLTLFKHPLND